jgi:hypothetical protein
MFMYLYIYEVFHFKTDIYLQILDRPFRISTKLFLNFEYGPVFPYFREKNFQSLGKIL